MKTIDLNADLGEGMPHDAELFDIVSSANIACGGHAGDAATIRNTLRLAHKKNVACGAHPGFADKPNFGRKRLSLNFNELAAQIRVQMELFCSIAAEEGIPVSHLKLHGALANMAAEDADVAKCAFLAANAVVSGIPVLALDNSAQVDAALGLDLPVIREAYADRVYTADGLLAPRETAGAVIEDSTVAARQCIQLVSQGTITAIDGSVFKSAAQSICLHGDNEHAITLAKQVRIALQEENVYIAPVKTKP